MRAYEFIIEAAYDQMIASMKAKSPEHSALIDEWLKWAKQSLVKADRIIWFMKVIRAHINSSLSEKELGTYQFSTIAQLAADIHHFYGYDYDPIKNYVYKDQSVSQVIADLKPLEEKFKKIQDQTKGVTPKSGDYELFKFPNGNSWWFVDRGFCDEESRSGEHCGNVNGQTYTDQRILSLRNSKMQVICTFILEPNDHLGEMKAKNNQKPLPKYHPEIIKLILWDRIKGIDKPKIQYNPAANFNVFDLNEKNLAYIDQVKPELITTQIHANPVDVLRAPDSIKQKYKNFIKKENPAISTLLFDTSNETWEKAIKTDAALVVYAPTTLDNWEDRVVNTITEIDENDDDERFVHQGLLLKSPQHISKNYDMLSRMCSREGLILRQIPSTINGYSKLCELAVESNYRALHQIPIKMRTNEIYTAAVKGTGYALSLVPKELQTPELCRIAVADKSTFLQFVSEEHCTMELCRFAVLKNIPALAYVPTTLEGYNELVIEVANSTSSEQILQYIPTRGRTYDLCLAIVDIIGTDLEYVPRKLRDRIMCQTAAAAASFYEVEDAIPQSIRQSIAADYDEDDEDDEDY